MNEADIDRLKHEKNVWRGIAIGLAATLVLFLILGGVGALFLTTQMQMRRAEAAMHAEEAMHQREVAEKARMEAEEAKRAAEKGKVKP